MKFYRGQTTARPSKISVVEHERLSEIGGRITWRLTLKCGHTRIVRQGRRCAPGTHGAQMIHGERFICVPRSLNCAHCNPLEKT